MDKSNTFISSQVSRRNDCFFYPIMPQGRGRNMLLISDCLRWNPHLSSASQLLDENSDSCSRPQTLLSVSGLPSQSSTDEEDSRRGQSEGRLSCSVVCVNKILLFREGTYGVYKYLLVHF